MSKWIVIISLALFSLNCRQANGKELTRVSMDSIADMVGFRANGSLRLLATRGFEFTISDGSKTQKVTMQGVSINRIGCDTQSGSGAVRLFGK